MKLRLKMMLAVLIISTLTVFSVQAGGPFPSGIKGVLENGGLIGNSGGVWACVQESNVDGVTVTNIHSFVAADHYMPIKSIAEAQFFTLLTQWGLRSNDGDLTGMQLAIGKFFSYRTMVTKANIKEVSRMSAAHEMTFNPGSLLQTNAASDFDSKGLFVRLKDSMNIATPTVEEACALVLHRNQGQNPSLRSELSVRWFQVVVALDINKQLGLTRYYVDQAIWNHQNMDDYTRETIVEHEAAYTNARLLGEGSEEKQFNDTRSVVRNLNASPMMFSISDMIRRYDPEFYKSL